MSGNLGVTGKGGVGRPEEELLLRAAAVSARPAPPPEGLDGDRLLALAAAHGLAPQLLRHLEDSGWGGCPGGFRERLREVVRERTVEAFALVGELAELIRAFAAAGIPAVPFKGPVLAYAAYGSFGLRQAVDLDFLLPKARVRAAGDLLLARGYVPERELPPAEEAAQFRVFCDRKYLAPGRPYSVELHWDIVPRFFCFSLPHEAVRRRLRPFSLAGESTLVLGPEDLLLVLAVHGAKHCFERLAWVADVARVVVTAGSIDWPALLLRARHRGGLRMLLLALYLAEEWLGARLPPSVHEAIAVDHAVPRLARELRAGLSAGPPRLLPQTLFHLRVRERPRDRLLYALRLALTPTNREWSTLRLPGRLFFLHYLRRPLRLLGLLARDLRRRHP